MTIHDIFKVVQWVCYHSSCQAHNETHLPVFQAGGPVYCTVCGYQQPRQDMLIAVVSLNPIQESVMPTKPISARARQLAYFATAPISEVTQLLDDAREIVAERKRRAGMTSGQANQPKPAKAQPQPAKVSKAKPAAGKANGAPAHDLADSL